jgi:hypothetical protein
MAGAIFVTREELEDHIGAQRVLDFFDDDRDGVLNDRELAKLNEVVAATNDTVSSQLLHKGWAADGLGEVMEDRAVRFAAKQIAASICGERKPEFYRADGTAPFAEQGTRGMKFLKDMARGDNRSRTEAAAGTNASIRGRISVSNPKRIFGRDPNDPTDGYGDGMGF